MNVNYYNYNNHHHHHHHHYYYYYYYYYISLNRIIIILRTIESFEDYVDPAASRSITAPQVDSITTQSMFMVSGENSTEELKRQH